MRLCEANQDASAGSLEEIRRIVSQIRQRWPGVPMLLRADSGFCREELMRWCEDNQVDCLSGQARNERLRALSGKAMRKAAAESGRTGKAARMFTEFAYRTRTRGSRAWRAVAKAERVEGKENPRMENRIKEQLSLFAGRMSAETMRANQLRLYLSAVAYVLIEAMRRLALAGTGMARAQVQTIRLRLLKIGAASNSTIPNSDRIGSPCLKSLPAPRSHPPRPSGSLTNSRAGSPQPLLASPSGLPPVLRPAANAW